MSQWWAVFCSQRSRVTETRVARRGDILSGSKTQTKLTSKKQSWGGKKVGWAEGKGVINKRHSEGGSVHLLWRIEETKVDKLDTSQFFREPNTGSRYGHRTSIRWRSMRSQEIYPIDSDIYDFGLRRYLLPSCPMGSKGHVGSWFSISFLIYGFLYETKDIVPYLGACSCPQTLTLDQVFLGSRYF